MSESGSAARRFPFVVSVLGGAIVLAFVAYEFASDDVKLAATYALAIIPVRYDNAGPAPFESWYAAALPLVGHVFLHGGWAHLLMNMLAYLQAAPFLGWRLGAQRFLALFFISAIGGAVAYILINPHSDGPAVGASGAICGLFGAYFLAVRPTPRAALADPQVRNAIVVFLGVNVVLMGVLAVMDLLPIAWEAHLGGFMAGALVYLAMAPRHHAGPWG